MAGLAITVPQKKRARSGTSDFMSTYKCVYCYHSSQGDECMKRLNGKICKR